MDAPNFCANLDIFRQYTKLGIGHIYKFIPGFSTFYSFDLFI